MSNQKSPLIHVHSLLQVPIIIPIIVVVVSLFLVLAPIIDDPKIEYLFIVLFFVVGLIFYVPFIHYEKHPPFMSKINQSINQSINLFTPEYITIFIQLAFQVTSASDDSDDSVSFVSAAQSIKKQHTGSFRSAKVSPEPPVETEQEASELPPQHQEEDAESSEDRVTPL
jgi:hypothetical protein